ncbi:hypothetical protein U9M48_022699 [Paspalum notatum var. saurae]|uniref:Uncharacterized protein n=1 Tax=Paspalum notatum var. saurae TaxID=547442 RepID=A0AAQ3TIR8_PASNO
MARSTRSAATERAYLRFAPAPMGVAPSPAEEFHESDIWGAPTTAPTVASAPAAEPPARARGGPPPAAARKAAAAHGSLPVNIPDWSKILGEEYHRAQHAPGDWEVDDADDEDGADAAGAALVPPHELAWQRRRAASLSVGGAGAAVGRTLKVRDAVWKRTTGFQD